MDIDNLEIEETKLRIRMYIAMAIENTAILICFTLLAIIFGKWWIVLVSALFMSFYKKK